MADPGTRPSPKLVGHGYAQTNLQLYNQLLGLGWSPAALEPVRRGYELATQLFAGGYRPSGKTLIAHLVGTASILAELGPSRPAVAAGLLHAAYSHGRFDDAESSPEARHARVREAIGAEAEALVRRYRDLAWHEDAIAGTHAALTAGRIEAADREHLAVRLANELEDHLDLGMLFSGEHLYHALYRGPAARRVVGIAEALGLPGLARALEHAFSETGATSRPPGLRRSERFVRFARP